MQPSYFAFHENGAHDTGQTECVRTHAPSARDLVYRSTRGGVLYSVRVLGLYEKSCWSCARGPRARQAHSPRRHEPLRADSEQKFTYAFTNARMGVRCEAPGEIWHLERMCSRLGASPYVRTRAL